MIADTSPPTGHDPEEPHGPLTDDEVRALLRSLFAGTPKSLRRRVVAKLFLDWLDLAEACRLVVTAIDNKDVPGLVRAAHTARKVLKEVTDLE